MTNVIGDSNDKTNFPYKLLFTNKQVSSVHKAFANNSSANIKLFKTQLSKTVQLGGIVPMMNNTLIFTAFDLCCSCF